MRPNWVHGQHPPTCTCTACVRNRRNGGRARGKSSRPRRSSAKGRGREERIHQECEAYSTKLCNQFNIRHPLLIFDDNLQNPGACGEAGQSTIWVQRDYFLREGRGERERVLRHELAHIAVHNTPGMGDVEAHGPEFEAELHRISNNGSGFWIGVIIGLLVLSGVLAYLYFEVDWVTGQINWVIDQISRLLR